MATVRGCCLFYVLYPILPKQFQIESAMWKEFFVKFTKRFGALGASLALAALATAGVTASVVTAPPARAAMVYNMMLCDPSTGWCYQTNPPYVPGIPHECQWDDNVVNLYSGMWYTGCNVW